MRKAALRATILSATLIPAAAFAQTAGSVTTDLNLRSGPGSNYSVIETIPAGDEVVVEGCVTDTTWCQVDFGGKSGYVYSQYLTIAAPSGETVVVSEKRGLLPEIAAETVDAIGNTAGAVTGALIGGTVGVVSGGVEGLGKGMKEGAVRGSETFNIAQPTVVYVEQHPVDPIYLDGEVIVGVGVPDDVVLYEVPESPYRYVNINGTPVLVDPNSRQVVYVFG
ncbi:DUF1236 domain-containing protein [Acuticoccus sp. I52.16.1]|uniref:DUF1236 domain-containing protein n=1 Tax=Acuticoccus sp. I52.16.1 TaxID=2928472 RepID=UPI001FD5F89A|nr:DUF1236 domain-containing protein [Acuticoccus sp. I52.16.1]UOM36031.1 DUF1236 domain-containing protein [Acuticoccus sp. I52.16.1]